MNNEEIDEEIITENRTIQLDKIIILAKELMPTATLWLENNHQSSERDQKYNLILMGSTLSVILILALFGIIDSSGATGLLGAIIGYVFGGFFHTKIQKI